MYIVIFLTGLAFIFTSMTQASLAQSFMGIVEIAKTPDNLLKDYLAIGGIGATFLNIGLVIILPSLVLYLSKVVLTGPIIAGIYTLGAFAFMGKNIFNILPIFLGGLIYGKLRRLGPDKLATPVLFATTLAPVVSSIGFGLGLDPKLGLLLGSILGILVGFVVSPLGSHLVNGHKGFNLYNIGFTGGVFGILIYSLVKAFGYSLEAQSILSTEYDFFLKKFLILLFLTYILLGISLDKKNLRTYPQVLKESGRFLTNFVEKFGYSMVLLNMGIMGIIAIIYVGLIGGKFNGPIGAGILTVAAFAPFGKHPKNTLPVFLGVLLSSLVLPFDPRATGVLIAGLFGTTLAPIAGVFGFFPGVLAGFLHLIVVTSVGPIHGGMNLYNNGFAGGIVASILLPILNDFYKKEI